MTTSNPNFVMFLRNEIREHERDMDTATKEKPVTGKEMWSACRI
jgi:hypothetical protein